MKTSVFWWAVTGTFCTSQAAYHRLLYHEPWLLNYRLALLALMTVLMCHSALSPTKTGLFIFVSISLTSPLLAVSLYLSVDCNKTLALQFVCSPRPKSSPATITSCGSRQWVTAIRQRYLRLKLHTPFPDQTCLRCSIIL